MKSHLGDPCIHCGTAHDDVAVGPCPGNDGVAALVREVAFLEAQLASYRRESEKRVQSLQEQIADRKTDLNRVGAGLDLDKIELAESVMFASDHKRGGDAWNSARQDALLWFSGAQKPEGRYYGDLRREFFGTKNYDRWYGQRCDCEYGMGPRHGSICFEIGIHRSARSRDLTPEEREAAVYYLVNLERIQDARVRQVA